MERPKNAMITEQAATPILFSVTEQTVLAMKPQYLALRVNGIEDKEGLAAVHEARMKVVKARTTCEREHKAVKEDALRECQRSDQSKRDILALIAPIEKHLTDQEQAVENEKARIKQEREDAIYRDRVKQIEAVGGSLPEITLRALSDEQFAHEVERAAEMTRLRKSEAERLLAEQAERDAQAERTRIAREALDKQRAEQAATEARLKKIQDDIEAKQRADEQAERDRLARIEREEQQRRDAEAERLRAIDRAEQMKRAQAEAAERARVETEQRLTREAEQAAAKLKEAEAEKLRQEALRPDREKLAAVADVVAQVQVPEVSQALRPLAHKIRQILIQASDDIFNAIHEED